MHLTYSDLSIKEGTSAKLSLRNIYDTVDINMGDHIARVPWNDFFTKYHTELENSLVLYHIKNHLFYRPKSLSLELYGTTELWLAILRANNMKNVTEFHRPYIYVYDPYVLKQYIDIFFKREHKN